MKIDYAIVSSNDNPLYFDFWDVVKKVWIHHIGIKPIFVYISDKDLITDNGDHIIHEIKKINGIDTGFQSQIARMYVTKFYKDSVCLTSDIDMLPLNKEYFNNIANDFDSDSMVIISADAYPNQNRYPLCYNAAKGSTFDEILSLDVNFEEYCNRLLKYKWGWGTDELYFGLKVSEFEFKDRIILLNRGWGRGIADRRIDRVIWGYDVEILKSGYYIDSHLLRPYSEYKVIIDQLVSHVC